ncbi:surface-associated interspersed protein (SURFIN) [Plasmodium gallinaceum]|uniref:Surface-associated interspersed protein (SURFIN) n=1 Tax=Plasmodium gallinaceum TaxID=5849 RepID=A0A1J1GVT2_PLAGA|nr:surface-associated interspersed protein (SURFIN) [Plasmodium gallinaceum]CRG96546.1 surface-associated interspersed protein (SURFIN) [Plasmodium gallinaceum]
MRKRSILRKARFLSQAEETSCILDGQNSKRKENGDISSSETNQLNIEIKTFMEDTNNELSFYLNDDRINNPTDKCQKSSSYLNWRGMDFVNLVLNEENSHNISSLVECWNKKQKSFETQIHDKINSTCPLKNFDYCAVLNKNDNCTSPYKDNNIPGLISLTYNQLNESEYNQNKTEIIYERASQFDSVTNSISNYYYKIYEANSNQLNCWKWSMYIYKRGRQFVNMMNHELYSEEHYRNEFVDNWNSFSNNLQQSILRGTNNQCNMTSLIYEIKKRENTTKRYDIYWILSDKQDNSTESLYPTISLPSITQSTMGTPDTPHATSNANSLDYDTKTDSALNRYSDSKNVSANDAIVTPNDEGKNAKITTTVSLVDPTQSYSLSSNDTHGYNSSKDDPSILLSSTNDNSTHPITIVKSSESNTTPSTTVPSPETTSSHTTMFSRNNNLSSSGVSASPITESSNSTTDDDTSLFNRIHSTNNHASPAIDMAKSATPSSVQPISVTENNSNGTPPIVNESLSEAPNSKPPVEAHTPLIKAELPKNDTVSPSSFKSLMPLDMNTSPSNTTESSTTNNDTQLIGKSYSPTQSSQNTLTPIAQHNKLPLIGVQNDTLSNCLSNCPTDMNVTNSTTPQTPLVENIEPTPTINPDVNILTIAPIGILILGIIFLLVILYRCTPIGSWFRNRKSRKKKIRKKIKKISKKPMPLSTNNIEDGSINSVNHCLLQHEKQMLLCEVSFERERNLKHEQREKTKEPKGIYNEKENKRIYDDTEVGSNKYENKFIDGEKLNTDNPKSEIKKEELNGNEPSSEIEDELNKNILEKDPVNIVWHIRNGTLNEEKENEINSQKEKSTCDTEMKNLRNKTSSKNDICNWNSWVDIHMLALLECKKEEWKLNKNEFFNICLEEIQKDGENSNLKEMGNNFIMKIKEKKSTDTIGKESSILEKYRNEKWFINLKKEWKEEQEKYLEYLEEHEIEKMTEMGVNNIILYKKKKIWKKWIEWQIEHSYKYKNQNWFIKLLEEYEKEEINEYLKEENIEKERNNGIDKCEIKKILERRILLDIHMMLLEECIKEELQKEEEFYKTNIIEIRKFKNLDEETNKLEKIERERSWNVISEKEKEEIEKWKKEKWFIELMLEWKNNEENYMMEINEEILAKKNQESVIDVILERQSNILKKHCENIYRKWKDDDNNEEWFTKLVKVHENEQKEYKSRIDNNSIEKKKENVKTVDICEPVIEFNKKGEEKMRKYERNSLQESYEKNNSIINKKKLKWKTLIEIYMVILEECRKEEWLLNKGKFLETCLDEFIKEEKEKYPEIIENDLAIIKEGAEGISTLMIEKQKLLWKKWVQRNKRMSEKWKNEEWFINLKKEWGKEQEKFNELTKESEISDIVAGKNPMLEKQKRIWKRWLRKQRMWFILHSEDEWFNNLLEEYEEEEECMKRITKKDTKKEKEIHENIEELKQVGDNEIQKNRKKRMKLIQKIWIEIHMTLLEECMKDEWQKEKEYFFKTMMEELKIQENLDENVIILEIKKKRSRNAILDIEKVEIEKWKKKKWFIELMLEMNNKEKTYIKDVYEDMIEKKNEEKIRNPMLEMQKIIWKKHCEDIHRRWIEKNNEEILQH